MTKHEQIDRRTRRARHAAEMRAKGYRLKQIWVPDTRTEAFREQARRDCAAINASDQASGDDAWAAAVADESLGRLPPYTAPFRGNGD